MSQFYKIIDIELITWKKLFHNSAHSAHSIQNKKALYIFKFEKQPHHWIQEYRSTLLRDLYHLQQF